LFINGLGQSIYVLFTNSLFDLYAASVQIRGAHMPGVGREFMSEIGAVVGFLLLVALLWSRIAAEQRQEEREDHSTARTSE
jgi:hypothetical protein